MSWDFDFEAENSFVADFDDADSIFLSGQDTALPNDLDTSFSEEDFSQLTAQPIQQINFQSFQPMKEMQAPPADLAEENDQLRQFFTSLKEKAAQAETLNQSLKSQLESCRSWFKDAMFAGISNQK